MVTAPIETWKVVREPVADGEIVARVGGSGTALLVVHHEIGSAGWLPAYERLSATRTVYVPDLPGYGESSRPEWARHPRDLAVLLQLWLDRTGLERLDVVGLGFGGWIAAEMATMNQGRIRRLVLANPYGLRPAEGEIMDQFIMSHEDFVHAGFHGRAAFDAVYGTLATVEQLEQWDIHREMTTRIAWKPYMFNPSLGPLLTSVVTPTLVLSSGDGDRIVPPSCARRYAELMPNARLEVIRDAGHFLEMERPDEFAAAVAAFTSEGA